MEIIRAIEDSNVSVTRSLTILCYHGFIIQDGNWLCFRRTGDLFRDWYLRERRRLKGGDVSSRLAPGFSTLSFLVAVALGLVSNVLASLWKIDSPQSILIAVGVFGLIMAASLWAENRKEGASLAGLSLLVAIAFAVVGTLALVAGIVWSFAAQ